MPEKINYDLRRKKTKLEGMRGMERMSEAFIYFRQIYISTHLLPFHMSVPSNLLSKLLGGSQMISPSKEPMRPSSCPISAVSRRHCRDFRFVSLEIRIRAGILKVNVYQVLNCDVGL